MKLAVYSYLPPDEWTVSFVWGHGGYHCDRIRAGTREEAERISEQMMAILKPAIESCDKLAQKTIQQKVIFDD